jgi:hypothetical protein
VTAAAKKAEPPEKNGASVKPAVMTAQAAKQIETLKQRLGKDLLDLARQLEKPWQKMNEKEQQRVIDRTQHLAGALVNDCVTTMASRGFPHFTVQVGKITIDKGIKADMTLPTSQAVLDALIAGKNQTMMLVARNEHQFLAGGKPPSPDVVGDLALPKSGRGAPSDEKALAQVGRGKPKPEQHDAETGELPPNPPAEQQQQQQSTAA